MLQEIKKSDVNEAMIQQAAEELEIGVPIRSWDVVGGRLVLFLAYGGDALWPPDANSEKGKARLKAAGVLPEVVEPGDGPWRFIMANAETEPQKMPEGSLGKVKKQDLMHIALSWGFQSNSDYVNKDELVEALEYLRGKVK